MIVAGLVEHLMHISRSSVIVLLSRVLPSPSPSLSFSQRDIDVDDDEDGDDEVGMSVPAWEALIKPRALLIIL